MAKYVDIVWLSSAIHNFCKGSPITEDNIHHLISLAPTLEERKVGKWIYDKTIQNWRCSECSETPKTMGYVGTADFMTEHFKFCNHCGTEMVGAENG